jgi:hypothetical protein
MTFLIFSLTGAIVDILKEIKESFSSEVDDWVNIFRIIGGLGAMITVTIAYFKDQSTGRPFSFSNYSNPFIVLLLLILYKPVLSVVDSFFGAMEKKSNNTWVQVANSFGNKTQMSFLSGILGTGSTGPQESKYNSKGTPEAIEKMTTIIASLNGTISDFNGEILKGDESSYVSKAQQNLQAIDFIKLFADSAGPTLRILARIILILLFITGPIAIGLSLFPIFKSSLSTWISAYIKISLWIIISNIIQFVIIKIMTDPRILLSTWFNSQIGDYGEGAGAAIFYGAIVLSQTLVPTIASSLIAASGFDSLSYSLSSNALTKANSFLPK